VTRPLNCPFKAPADCHDLDPVIKIATETAQEDHLLLDHHRPMVGTNRRSQLFQLVNDSLSGASGLADRSGKCNVLQNTI
jgi:hypothetical protein